MAEHKVTRAQLKDPDFALTLATGEIHRVIVEDTWFEVQILDAKGEPVPDVPLGFAQGDRSEALPTDGDGVGRFESPRTDTVQVRLEDLEAARQILDPRWENGRDENLADSGATILSLKRAAEGLALEAEQRIQIALVPLVVRIRLVGMHFETAKSFLLPSAMEGIRRLVQIYGEHPSARVLTVGHTDTKGDESYNTQLSLERADAVGAFLTDQVDPWLDWYGAGKRFEKRWGTREDQHMLSALPDDKKPYYAGPITGVKDLATDAAIRRFQADHGLEVDGVAGPNTRRALVESYMGLDGTSLPEGCELVTHGCGEYFPEEPTGDNQESEENRRVEIFIFEGPIVPPPPGKTSKRDSPEYPAWRAQVTQTVDVSQQGGPTVSAAVGIWLHDHMGQRMGANPASPDPITRERGAPYRLTLPDGVVRTGHADAEGLAVEYDLPTACICRVQWGKLEDAHEAFPPHEEEDAEAFYLYSDYIFLESDPGAKDYHLHQLFNLGYGGSEDEARAAFAEDYGTGDDGTIEAVHDSGQAKTLA